MILDIPDDKAKQLLGLLVNCTEELFDCEDTQLAEMTVRESLELREHAAELVMCFPLEMVETCLRDEYGDDDLTGHINEALCLKCRATFNPAHSGDLVHGLTEDESFCGGLGVMTGTWG